MITLNKIGDYHNRQVLEIECLKADEKPIGTIDGLVITNGSKLHELDGDTYEYDEQNKTWVLQPKSSGGADGREIELQKTQTHIQWRYVGTEEWFDLVSLDEISFKHSDFTPEQLQALKGAKGDKGNPGTNGTNGKDGLSIKSTQINDSGHLILTFSDESTKDVGKVTGENGESAYQIAIKLGYKGTEQEWIESLKYDHSEEFTKLAAEVRNTASGIVADRQQIGQNKADVTQLKEALNGFVPKNQGVENKDKILGIDADGVVVPVEKPSGGSGSGVDLDATLTSADKAAPAKAVGELKNDLESKQDKYIYRNETHYNLWNSESSKSGVEVVCDTGERSANNMYYTCDYIPVEQGKSYYFGRANGTIMNVDKPSISAYALYDKNKKLVPKKKASIAGEWNPIPDGVAYIRFTVMYKTWNDDAMVVEGLDAPKKYISYKDSEKVTAGWLDVDVKKNIEESTKNYIESTISLNGEKIIDKSIQPEKTTFVTVEKYNLNDISKVNQHTNLTNEGELSEHEYTDTTDYIRVEKNVTYYVNNGISKFCLYNSEKKMLSFKDRITTKDYINGIRADENGFLRITYKTGVKLSVNTFGMTGLKSDYGYESINIVAKKEDSILNKSKWNLLSEKNRFRATINLENGDIQNYGNEKANAYYIVKNIETSKTYINYYNANHNHIVEYDSDGNFIKLITLNGEEPHSDVYHPSSNCNIIFLSGTYNDKDMKSDFFAEYDENKNKYIQQENNVDRYSDELFIESFKSVVYKKTLLDLLLAGEKNKLIQTIYNSKGLKWNCLGDSLTTMNWGHNMYNIVSEQLGLIPTNHGIVSSTIADYQNDGKSGNPMCVRYAEMSDNADIVTVMGGTNDWATSEKIGTMSDRAKTTLYGACHILFRGLIEKYPNAKIGVILPPQNGQGIPSYVESQGGDRDMEKMKKKVKVIREVAEYYSLPVCDLFNHGLVSGMLESNIGKLIQGDYLHLTTAGYEKLAPMLMSFIKTLLS